VKEPPYTLQFGLYDLQTPLVVPSSDPRWMAAPHRTQKPNQDNHTELTDKIRPDNDDIIGWPDELAIDLLEYVLSWTTHRQTPPD
jgi:hypothetical protein